MPTVVVLLLVAFFGAGLWLLAQPVFPATLSRFAGAHSLRLDDSTAARLHGYLAVRRRARVGAVLIAAAVGLIGSIPYQRLDFAFVPLLAAWLAGAIAAELAQRDTGVREVRPVAMASFWVHVPVATAVIALLWTAMAVWLRGAGAPVEPLVAWGSGALATALVLRAVVAHLLGHSLRDLDPSSPDMLSATTFDAVRGLVSGGTALALLCLGNLWNQAVPGPYDQVPDLVGVLWLAAIVSAALAIRAVPAAGPGRAWWFAVAVVLVLPLLWAVPTRSAQQPPLSAQQAGASGRIALVRPALLRAAQAGLGLEPEPPIGQPDDASPLATEFIGRVDVARPAPAGAAYQLFVFDRRTKRTVNLFGPTGSSWSGAWTTGLSGRYAWLSGVMDRRDSRGFTNDPAAVSPDPESGLLWFRAWLPDADHSVEDLQPVLMLVRDDSYIYWATEVPSTIAAT